MMHTRKIFAVTFLSLAAADVALGQCADGTPPPCDARRSAPMTLIPRAPALPSTAERGKRFLILPFRNVTRQADQDWLVEGSTTMLVDALGRWQGITVVSDEKLYPALKRAGIVPGTVADATRVRRVAEETGGWTAVTGEVLATGGRVRITARAWDVPTGRELVRASSEIPSGGDVRAAFDSVSLRLLRTAGVDSITPNIAGSTTHNLDAYRGYLSGLAHMRRSEVKPAIKEFQDAVRLDSGFALGWYHLAELTLAAEPGSIVNPQSAAAQYSRRAVALSAKLPARDRQLVLANDAIFNVQFGEARRLLEGLVAADSNDVDALSHLIGLETSDMVLVDVPGGQRPRGSGNRAARLAKRVAELDPTRHAMLGFLASIFASAGVPGAAPTFGVDRAPSSFTDLMDMLRQRDHRRIYYPVFGDSLQLVPAESLSFIPRDSLKALRKNARAAGRQWADRWVAVAGDEAAPYALISELYALDQEYPAALRALAKAESLGVQTPTWSVPARRLSYLAKGGNLMGASRLADSLTAAGFFANPNNMLQNNEAAIWAFTLHLLGGRIARAGALLDQQTSVIRLVSPSAPIPDFAAYQVLMGNSDPEEEPRVPRSVRAMELDSLLVHVAEAAASTQIGPWVPMLLPDLAERADSSRPRTGGLLKAADALASAGRGQLAFQLASNTVVSDSTLEVEAAKYPWYRGSAEAFNAAKRAVQERFRPASATVGAERAVFEWAVADSAPFPRNRIETPPGRGEYRWEVTVNAADRYYRFGAGGPPRAPSAVPTSGTLAEILVPGAGRYVNTGKLSATGVQQDTTGLPSVSLRTEMAPGVLRLIITDHALLDALRRAKPAEARFSFFPCVRPVGSAGKLECKEAQVRITYP